MRAEYKHSWSGISLLAIATVLASGFVAVADARQVAGAALTAETPPPSSRPASAPTRADESDFEARIGGFDPPTVEDIVASLGPIPTLRELLASLGEPEVPRPKLPERVAVRVAEMENSIAELSDTGFAGPDKTIQDAALTEALELAEEVLTIRREHQSKWLDANGESVEWYEIGDARRTVTDLVRWAELNIEQRAALKDVSAKEEIDSAYLNARYVDALSLVNRRIDLRRRLLGEHALVAAALTYRAEILRANGDYVLAEQSCRQALSMANRILGDEHPTVAACQRRLAAVLTDVGNYVAAEPLFRVALARELRLVGSEHHDVAITLNSLALLLKAKGDYTEAEPLMWHALAITRQVLGDDHHDVTTIRHNLACLLRDRGDYAEAETLFREVLASYRATYGDDHLAVADCVGNLAGLLFEKGDYSSAEPLVRNTLSVYRATLGDDHPVVAQGLGSLAGVLQGKGDYSAAEQVYREALAMERRLLGNRHPNVVISLNNLASLLDAKGDYAAAEVLYSEAMEIACDMPGNHDTDIAMILGNLASLLCCKDEYNAAEPLARVSLALRRRSLGDRHPIVANALNNLGRLLRVRGEYARAEPLIREALATNRALLGESHPDVVVNLEALARLLCARGDFSGAEPLLVEAVEAFEVARLRANTQAGLSRTLFRAGDSPHPLLAALLARRGDYGVAWHHLESRFARGLLDEITLRQARSGTEQERNSEESLIGRLNKLDERISSLLQHAESEDRGELVKKLRREREQLRGEFVQVEATMRDKYGVTAGEARTLAQIQASLAADAALIAWLDIGGEPHAADPSGEHWACLVRKTGEPIWVKLVGSGADGAWTKEDDTLPNGLRKALTRGTSPFQPLTEALYRQRIGPVVPYLEGIRQLIVLPAGWMGGVPIETLTARYVISYAPSGTMYAYLAEKDDRIEKRLLALGDPVFRQAAEELAEPLPVPPDHGALVTMVTSDSNAARGGVQVGDVLLTYDTIKLSGPEDLSSAIQKPVSSERDSKATPSATGVPVQVWRSGTTVDLTLAPGRMGVRISRQSAAEAIEAQRSLNGALATTRGKTHDALPGTRSEVTSIRELFGSSLDHVELLGSDASEQALAALAEANELRHFGYLHFATHCELDDERAMNSALILAQDNLPDPFDQVLAGDEPFDGRLTAEQVVRTWQLNAELVTLSGCETALGRRVAGEGFLGFSQALFIAGARSVLLSLWKVDDTATALMMNRFYENILGQYEDERRVVGRAYRAGQAMPKADALFEAKLWLRSSTPNQNQRALKLIRTRGFLGGQKAGEDAHVELDFSDPYFWAAFVLIGDPA